MKFKKGVMDDHSDNFAIVFAAMGVSKGVAQAFFFWVTVTYVCGMLLP